MEHLTPLALVDAASLAERLSSEEYVKLLHPKGSVGKPTIMLIEGKGSARGRACAIDIAPFAAEAVLDGSAYITLNRFFGPRRASNLAALNALYLDLDAHAQNDGKPVDPYLMSGRLHAEFERHGLVSPSLLLHTGRGMAAIWLINPLPSAALPRWSAAIRALIGLFRAFGADPACSDAARVFRLPGTTNLKSRRTVRIVEGTLRRYDFDELADRIYRACGRPERVELRNRKARQDAAPLGGTGTPRGLSPFLRFRVVERDLERLREAWGGEVPEGRRNTWLHLYATCLTHTAPADIEERVRSMADLATPGLKAAEVQSVIAYALRRADLPCGATPLDDGRLHYAGATMAERLSVTDEEARRLGLEQLFSSEERARRKSLREKERRAAAGATDREQWLAQNATSREKPWVAAGVSRATWYRRRAAAEAPAAQEVSAEDPDETSSCPLQGAIALPKAKAGRAVLPATGPFLQKTETRRHPPDEPGNAANTPILGRSRHGIPFVDGRDRPALAA